ASAFQLVTLSRIPSFFLHVDSPVALVKKFTTRAAAPSTSARARVREVRMAESYLPILMLMLFAIGIAGAMILLSAVLGPRLRTRRKLDTYESGMPLLDASRRRVSIQFFLIARVFILFDVEIAFLLPWHL